MKITIIANARRGYVGNGRKEMHHVLETLYFGLS